MNKKILFFGSIILISLILFVSAQTCNLSSTCVLAELQSVTIEGMNIKVDIDSGADGPTAVFIMNDDESDAGLLRIGESHTFDNGYTLNLFTIDEKDSPSFAIFELVKAEIKSIQPEKKPLEIPDEEEIIYNCQGCRIENLCYPFNYRLDKEYCSINGTFEIQLEAEASCNNDFECESNICIDNSCVSAGLWRKILNWFKSLFS